MVVSRNHTVLGVFPDKMNDTFCRHELHVTWPVERVLGYPAHVKSCASRYVCPRVGECLLQCPLDRSTFLRHTVVLSLGRVQDGCWLHFYQIPTTPERVILFGACLNTRRCSAWVSSLPSSCQHRGLRCLFSSFHVQNQLYKNSIDVLALFILCALLDVRLRKRGK